MKQEYKNHYKDFLDSWGYDAQAMMAIEEMSELTKELCKRHRKRADYKEEDMIEEIADVLNMVEQLEYFFGFTVRIGFGGRTARYYGTQHCDRYH